MRIFNTGQISPSEKQDILDKHRTLYNGFRTMEPKVSNEQPLYVQDFAGDKDGMTINNKGTVKKYTNVGINESINEEKEMCSECGSGYMEEGICNECGYGNMEEGEGKLDDIYHEEDLNPSEDFDYVEGGGNSYGVFHKGLKEQGGNADDMNVSDVEAPYNFQSTGPMVGDAYPVNEDGDDFDKLIDMDNELEDEREELEEDDFDFDEFSSAFEPEMDEVDVSGSQGIYGDMEPAFDFDSDGPGEAGPYQTRNEAETSEQIPRKHEYKKMMRKKDALSKGEDFNDSELDISDYGDDFSPESSSWEEITKMTGDDEFSNVDEDIRESLINQKNRINEMMLRMKVIK